MLVTECENSHLLPRTSLVNSTATGRFESSDLFSNDWTTVLHFKPVLAVPLLGTGMQRNIAWRRFGVLAQLANPRVGIFPENFVFARVDGFDHFVGVFIRE